MVEVGVRQTESNAALRWEFGCPVCRNQVQLTTPQVTCRECRSSFTETDGIWRLLTPETAAKFSRFSLEYSIIRRNEGWGSSRTEYYKLLPNVPKTDPNEQIWHVRTQSLRTVVRRALGPLEDRIGRPLKIVELGAGNCWFSFWLSKRGHNVIALDVSVDAKDGLGSHTHYVPENEGRPPFFPVQADFHQIPLCDGQADLAIFNGSFHYATHYATAVKEALRILNPDGAIILMDSPYYNDAASGKQMVAEREARFRSGYGFPSASIASENYVTGARLHELAETHGVEWELFFSVGLGWRIARRIKSWSMRGREPATFPVIVGTPVAVS